MGRDKVSEEIVSAVNEVFPGLRELIERRRMDNVVSPKTREEEHKRRMVLRNQAAELQRLQREACGQMVLPIFGTGAAKKLAQSEISSLPFKGMDVRKHRG